MTERPPQRSNARDAAEAERARAAKEALSNASQAELAGTSAFARAANHMRARDVENDAEGHDDPIEVWGTRLGRGLALAFAIGLVIWLVGHLTR